MEKVRIVIADEQEAFVFPLQMRFIQEDIENAEYELITDVKYFDELFMLHQQIDILVVSERLYRKTLELHDISHVFVILEDQSHESFYQNCVCFSIFTNIQTIVSGIIGLAKDVFKDSTNTQQTTKVISIYSAKGGSGKTTVALALSALMSKNFKRVLYVNATQMQVQPLYFKNEARIKNHTLFDGLMEGLQSPYDLLKSYIKKNEFYYLPSLSSPLITLGLDFKVFTEFINGAKKDNQYDYIIVDVDNDYSDEKTKILGLSDKVIYLVLQNDAAVYATNLMIENFTTSSIDKFLFVKNQIGNQKILEMKIKPNFIYANELSYCESVDESNIQPLKDDESMQKLMYMLL